MAEPLELFNRALYAIGESAIGAVAEGSTKSTILNAIYANTTNNHGVRDAVLREWPMRVTEQQGPLAFTNTTLTLSSAAVGTGVTATAGAAFFTANDVGRYLYEVDSDGNDTGAIAEITAYTGTTIVTVEITAAWSGVGPHAAGYWRMQPHQTFSEQWAYEYVLPTGTLAIIEATTGARWQRVGNRIFSDTTPLHIRYTYRETEPGNWDPLLYEAMVFRLASEISEPLERKGKRVEMLAQYEDLLANAKLAGDNERANPVYQENNTLLTEGRW